MTDPSRPPSESAIARPGEDVAQHGPSVVEVVVRVDTPNWTNVRMHWGEVGRRKRLQRKLTAEALEGRELPWGPWVVTLHRRSQNRADLDGLVTSQKSVRDQVAWALGVDDSPTAPVKWRYAQSITRDKRTVQNKRGKRKREVDASVTIRIEGAGQIPPRREHVRRVEEVETPGSWNPPYANAEELALAQSDWLDAHPEQTPPWAVEEPPPLPPPLRPTTTKEITDRAIARAKPQRDKRPEPPPPPPPPPPADLTPGTRCRVLTGPVNDYHRAETRDGTVVGWDGVALSIRLDGLEGVRRYVESRVSPFDPWGRPVYWSRVTWIRGDKVPVLPPDAPTRPPPSDEQFPKASELDRPAAAPDAFPKPYPGMFVR
jgi:hypothetical protein